MTSVSRFSGTRPLLWITENEFEIVVRQASEQNVSYFLEVFVDGELFAEQDILLRMAGTIQYSFRLTRLSLLSAPTI